MNYYYNFQEQQKKSQWRFWFGVSFIISAVLWVFLAVNDNEKIQAFDWFYFAVMLLNGIVHTADGMGYYVEGLFGEAYIQIDDERIVWKPRIFRSKKEFCRSNIKKINYSHSNLTVYFKDGSSEKLSLRKIPYAVIQNLKANLETPVHNFGFSS